MSAERRKPYPFDEIEPRWQRHWEERGSFHAPNPGEPGFDPARPKYYVLDMFPYPSGSGLHVGHPEGYTATDIIARYKRMRGFNVLHPMGWDAFGLPAEQHAIKTGEHPSIQTRRNIDNFRRQLKAIGFAYDWQREVNTTDEGYYQWTQWIFLQLYGSWFNPETQRAEPIETYSGGDPDSARLAYVSEAPVNWSPDLGTVLANEEVEEWRAKGHTVERRPMRQWMLRITAYAQRLIDELEGLDWPESIKLLQRNWIGRSEGAEVHFGIDEEALSPSRAPLPEGVAAAPLPAFLQPRLTVFTTRPDTLFGATYMVLAPEHPLVDFIVTAEQRAAVLEYREKAASKSDLERTELAKEKSGVFTGSHATNPVNGQRIPIWIADYVLMGYGTGAIMAVPAHDERDWEFAKKFHLPIRQVVAPAHGGEPTGAPVEPDVPASGLEHPEACFTGEGVAVNSPIIDGLPTAEAKRVITAWLEERGLGRKTVNYKLRDWLFSRQRYWGEPFPIVWEGGRHRAVPESELPVALPEMADFKPTGTPEPPLSKAREWLRYTPAAAAMFPLPSLGLLEGAGGAAPESGAEAPTALRETNTMPQWAGSCWYYLRYCDPRNSGRFVGREAESYWMTGRLPAAAQGDAEEIHPAGLPKSPDEIAHEELGPVVGDAPSSPAPAPAEPPLQEAPVQPGGVDLYVGGTEHAVLHLLYARFWHKALFDLGHVSTPEPFQRLVNQGIILGEDGQKMSKSRGNVVNPDDVISAYGADAFRCYEMFMGPLEQMKPWSMTGVEGVSRFLARVWRLVMEENQADEWVPGPLTEGEPDKAGLKVIHATIKKVGEDIETLSFNTALAQMMVFVNHFTGLSPRPVSALRTLLQLLNPFAPHLTSELWEVLARRFPGPVGDIAGQPWPVFDPAILVEDEVELPVQVNSKVRDKIVVKKDATREELEAAALACAKVQEHLAGKTVRKVVIVPGKLVNLVAG